MKDEAKEKTIFMVEINEKGAGEEIKPLNVKTLTNVLVLIASDKAAAFLFQNKFNYER
jgi:hypothetical protein